MKSPLCQCQQLVTSFMSYYNDELDESWVALARVTATTPDSDALTFCAKLQQERETF